jgi:hypothetical protein
MTPTKKVTKKAKNPNLYSKSKLAIKFQLDRSVVSKRILKAGIEPHPDSTDNEQLFELNKALSIALQGNATEKEEKTVASIDLKNEKLQIELQKIKGEVVSTDEVSNAVAALFGGLHKRIVIQDLKDLVKKVRAAKDLESGIETARRILNNPFMDARENHERFLK